MPPVPENPVSRPGDLWLCGNESQHRVLCGDSTSAEAVARLLGDRKPQLMVTDPPYGIELDSEWRDRAGLNGCGPAEASYMKHRTEGHTETTISGDTRADWSEAFELVPSLAGRLRLARIEIHARSARRPAADRLPLSPADHLEQGAHGPHADALLVSSTSPAGTSGRRTPPGSARPARTRRSGTRRRPKFIMGGSDEEKFDHPTQKPVELMRRPILNHTKRGELVYEPFLGSGTTLAAAELTERVCYGIELDPKYVDVVVQRWQTAERQGSHAGRRRADVRGDRAGTRKEAA